jgi:hypothetical protein
VIGVSGRSMRVPNRYRSPAGQAARQRARPPSRLAAQEPWRSAGSSSGNDSWSPSGRIIDFDLVVLPPSKAGNGAAARSVRSGYPPISCIGQRRVQLHV